MPIKLIIVAALILTAPASVHGAEDMAVPESWALAQLAHEGAVTLLKEAGIPPGTHVTISTITDGRADGFLTEAEHACTLHGLTIAAPDTPDVDALSFEYHSPRMEYVYEDGFYRRTAALTATIRISGGASLPASVSTTRPTCIDTIEASRLPEVTDGEAVMTGLHRAVTDEDNTRFLVVSLVCLTGVLSWFAFGRLPD